MSSNDNMKAGPLSPCAKRPGRDLQALLAALGPDGLEELNAAAVASGMIPAPPGNNASAAAGSTAPPGNNSTTAPPGNNSTTAPPGNNSTTAPPGNNAFAAAAGSTAPPGNNASAAAAGSTAPPGNNASAAAAGSTAPPGNNSTTAPPGNNASAAAAGSSAASPRKQKEQDPSRRPPPGIVPPRPSPGRPPSNNGFNDGRRPQPSGPRYSFNESFGSQPGNQSFEFHPGNQPVGRQRYAPPQIQFLENQPPWNILHDANSFPAASSSRYQHGPRTSTPRRGLNTSGGGAWDNGFNSSNPYPRTYLPYCKAGPNAVAPAPGNGRYQRYGAPGNLNGTQFFGSPTPSARIRKIDMQPRHVVIMDTDGQQQRLDYENFGAYLFTNKAADMLSISSSAPGHHSLNTMRGWTSFLEPCKEFCIDGLLTGLHLKRIIPRLPRTLKTLTILPNESSFQIGSRDVRDFPPVRNFTLDATLVSHCDLDTCVYSLHAYECNRFARLILFGRSFPAATTLNAFFNHLDSLTMPGAAISLFTTYSPNDAVIQPLLNRGFLAGYRHKRTHGKYYDIYHLAGQRRYLVGFLVEKEEDPGEELDDEEDIFSF